MPDKLQYRYGTTILALKELNDLGYTIDYNIECTTLKAQPEDFDIVYIYRYEGQSDPDDESSVYGIANTKTGEKGVYVLGNLGTDVDSHVQDFLIQLEIKRRNIEF